MDDLLYLALTVLFFLSSLVDPQGGRAAVSAENLIGLVVSVLLLGYLLVALLFPERF